MTSVSGISPRFTAGPVAPADPLMNKRSHSDSPFPSSSIERRRFRLIRTAEKLITTFDSIQLPKWILIARPNRRTGQRGAFRGKTSATERSSAGSRTITAAYLTEGLSLFGKSKLRHSPNSFESERPSLSFTALLRHTLDKQLGWRRFEECKFLNEKNSITTGQLFFKKQFVQGDC